MKIDKGDNNYLEFENDQKYSQVENVEIVIFVELDGLTMTISYPFWTATTITYILKEEVSYQKLSTVS